MEEKSGLMGLKIIRKQKKLNQLKVALDLNISREALSHYENRKRSPDLEMLLAISKYFNRSIDYLITGNDFNDEKKASLCIKGGFNFCLFSAYFPKGNCGGI